MSGATWRGLGTVIVLLSFVGLLLWAWSQRRRADFEEAARLPFADEPTNEPGDE